MRDTLILLAILIPLGCAGGGGRSPAGRERIAPHETYVLNPTEIRARKVRAIFPASYTEELAVKGLSDGWREDGQSRTWDGTGACFLTLHLLKIECRELSVALVADQNEPEVMITAVGDVFMGHGVRGVATYIEEVPFLLLRNERSLQR